MAVNCRITSETRSSQQGMGFEPNPVDFLSVEYSNAA
jgi:hypothetical protein